LYFFTLLRDPGFFALGPVPIFVAVAAVVVVSVAAVVVVVVVVSVVVVSVVLLLLGIRIGGSDGSVDLVANTLLATMMDHLIIFFFI